ncbi:hypothetical protein AGMMS49975_13070 [Clostridia bacterium]|nr:hypothetical protein AGMMS49975_13070 [Clostridia bacterium]
MAILSMKTQVVLFFTAILAGGAMGVMYDFFKISRRLIKHSDLAVAFEDVLYWILAAFFMFCTALFRNNGEIRGFLIIGAFCGTALYLCTISHFLTNIATKLLMFIFKTLLTPIKIILKFSKKGLQKLHSCAKIKKKEIPNEGLD